MNDQGFAAHRFAGAVPVAPAVTVTPSSDLATLNAPGSVTAESIVGIRSNILIQHVGDRQLVLAVVAPQDTAGTSFIAANLAVASAQVGIDTVLIDANLRQPQIEAHLTPSEPQPGLLQLLSGEVESLDDVLVRDAIPQLSILYSGGTALNAHELLGANELKAVMDKASRDFQLTIIDTPPSAHYADARIVAAAAGSALIVARKDDTFVSDARTLIEGLRSDGVNVIGSVLNGV